MDVLKREAQVTLTLGTKVISELQDLLISLTKRNDMTVLKLKIEKKEKLDGEEQGMVSLYYLLDAILKEAKKTGQTEEKEMKDIIGGLIPG